MPNEKASERDRVILEFGILISPLDELAKRKTAPTDAELRLAMAKVQAGDNAWRRTVAGLCTFAHDLVYSYESSRISHCAEVLCRRIADEVIGRSDGLTRSAALSGALESARSRLFDTLSHVPIAWESELFAANTPFTSYLRIKETLALVSSRLDYFDRYLKPEFFHLFLRYVPRTVSVTLVTTSGQTGHHAYGVADVSPVSNLARQEFTDYKLVQVNPPDVHDRNLRVDDAIFTLGPGTDRAGIALTNFAPAESTPAAHAKLDAVIAAGTVIHQS